MEVKVPPNATGYKRTSPMKGNRKSIANNNQRYNSFLKTNVVKRVGLVYAHQTRFKKLKMCIEQVLELTRLHFVLISRTGVGAQMTQGCFYVFALCLFVCLKIVNQE